MSLCDMRFVTIHRYSSQKPFATSQIYYTRNNTSSYRLMLKYSPEKIIFNVYGKTSAKLHLA